MRRINRTQAEMFSGHSCKSAFQPYKIHPRVIRHLSTMRFVPLPSLITRSSRENLHKNIQTINPNIPHEPRIAQGTKTVKKKTCGSLHDGDAWTAATDQGRPSSPPAAPCSSGTSEWRPLGKREAFQNIVKMCV